ncbi:MAG: HNH endonuclease signature motif containing protein [Bacteroidota bacterium]
MSRYIPAKDRKAVSERAMGMCEYCLMHEDDGFFTFHIDHIISLKHGGTNELDNLCLACMFCNGNKSSDIGTILLPGDRFIRLYNPRKDKWQDHFTFDKDEGILQAKTDIGRATIKVLEMNKKDRCMERESLAKLDRYLPEVASTYLDNQASS